MIILRYFLRLTAPAAMPGHLGAVNLKKYHDMVILSFYNIVKGQANGVGNFEIKSKFR